MDKKSIHISMLFLDSDNPRHDPVLNQREIIKLFLKNEKIRELARDICNQKSLSPLDIVGVLPTESSDEYIVLEGNRRVCACMLLNNPDQCPSENHVKYFRQLQITGNYPEEIECVIFESRDQADHWIRLRHEGAQDGVGTRSWDATQTARYAEKRGRRNPNIQTNLLLDYAIKEGLIDELNRKTYSITTLQRYLNNPVVRNVFGLKDRHSLESHQNDRAFKRLVKRFLDDAKNKDFISSRTKKDDWEEYANKLAKEVAEPPSKTNPVQNYAEFTVTETESNKAKIIRSRPDPTKRKYLIPSDIKFPIEDKTLRRIYQELQSLEIEGHEFSTAYLLRAFIEGLSITYLRKHDPSKLQTESKLHKKLKWVSDHLRRSDFPLKKLNPLDIAASSSNSLLSPMILGCMVHQSIIPTKRELINIWDRMEDILIELNNRSKTSQ